LQEFKWSKKISALLVAGQQKQTWGTGQNFKNFIFISLTCHVTLDNSL